MLIPPSPQAFDLKPILELRARFERRVDRDFSDATDDSAGDLLSRFRGGARFTKGRLKGQVVFQYAHDENWGAARNAALWRSDLLLANVETPVGPGSLIVGRQRLSLGSERLLGVADWNNVSNAWEGGRFTAKAFDLFAVRSAVLPAPNEEVALVGGTATFRAIQALAVFKHDARDTEIDETTVSVLYRNALGPIRLDAEAAGQFGHRNAQRKLAGAIDVIATVPVVRRLTFSAQGSVASGGGHGDTTRAFDPLYPSVHDKHGLLDLATWKNVRDLGLWFRYNADKATSLKLQVHALALDSARDAWYGGNGAANRRPGGVYRDPTGAKGRDLGDEFDVDATRTLNPHQTVRVGVGVFRPGRFVRAFNGSATDDQVWGYVQWAYRF